MAVMADGSFPFGAVGLVHVENSIAQHRRIGIDEELRLRVRPTKLEPHPKGQTFTLVTEALVGRQKAWESVSTFLRRGRAAPTATRRGASPSRPSPTRRPPAPNGASAATSAAVMPPSPAIATRSTCTR